MFVFVCWFKCTNPKSKKKQFINFNKTLTFQPFNDTKVKKA